MTRSACGASAIRAGVCPRISPSTSSGSGGSVSIHSSLTARNARLGHGTAGPIQRMPQRCAHQRRAPRAAKPVDQQQPVVGAGVAGDRAPGMEAAIGDIELVGVQRVGPVTDGDTGVKGPVPGKSGQRR